MAERKIFNYESKVLIEKTIKEEGYHPDTYGKTSQKHIWAICRFCGEPNRVMKGNFNKAGSACHDKCRFKEQSISGSPFARDDVKEKAKKTNLERYGSEHASSNKEIAKKISDTKLTEEYQTRVKQTNLKKYGVENTFQSEEIKGKIKTSMLEKHGVEHPAHSDKIQQRKKNTCMLKYGVANPLQNADILNKQQETNLIRHGFANPQQNPDIKARTLLSFNESIKDNAHYLLINTLRGQEFWKLLSNQSLKDTCSHFELDYQSVTARLLHEEFREKYYTTYSFPRQQKQKEIFNYLMTFCPDVVMNERSCIAPLELDIFVPSKNFAVEFNGSYWHSEACLNAADARMKHYQKTILCREKNIRLFHIFEDTWDKKKSQILNFIKTILDLNSVKIPARKCQVTNTECAEFIDANHIQGHGNRTIKYFNLEHDGRIIASMTAAPHHRQNTESGVIVLNRLCFADGVNVQGGASKLFKSFVDWAKVNSYNKIVSWSDTCWTDGAIYKVLSFSLEKEYGPGYFYWDEKNRQYVSKQSQIKSKVACPEGMTEREWCLERGLYRIWDCGKKKWTFTLK